MIKSTANILGQTDKSAKQLQLSTQFSAAAYAAATLTRQSWQSGEDDVKAFLIPNEGADVQPDRTNQDWSQA